MYYHLSWRPSNDYKAAKALYNEGDYEKAAIKFLALGNYTDAKMMAQEAEQRFLDSMVTPTPTSTPMPTPTSTPTVAPNPTPVALSTGDIITFVSIPPQTKSNEYTSSETKYSSMYIETDAGLFGSSKLIYLLSIDDSLPDRYVDWFSETLSVLNGKVLDRYDGFAEDLSILLEETTDAVARGSDAIIIAPGTSSTAFEEICSAAQQNGIIVLCVGCTMDNANSSWLIGDDYSEYNTEHDQITHDLFTALLELNI